MCCLLGGFEFLMEEKCQNDKLIKNKVIKSSHIIYNIKRAFRLDLSISLHICLLFRDNINVISFEPYCNI